MKQDWNRATPENPCKVCGGKDNCCEAKDGSASLCGRVSEGSISTNSGGQYLHMGDRKTNSDWWVHPSHKQERRQTEQRDEQQAKPVDYEKLVNAGPDALPYVEQLAEETSVAVSAYQAIGVGYNTIKDPCWTFPERNQHGDVIGINRRFMDGSKMSIGERGLTFANDFDKRDGPLLIVEGGTDTAGGESARLATVGRFSNSGGAELLAELLRVRNIPASRPVIVLGEDDRLKNGQPRRTHAEHGDRCECGQCFPGLAGCKSVAKRMAEILGREIKCAMPPDGAKDLRAWLIAQGDVDPSTLGEKFVAGLRPITRTAGLLMRSAGDLVREFPELRLPVIEELLRCGETMNIIAASKFGKSWLMLLLAFCIACGPRKWLNKFWTTRGKVLYVDNELHPETLAHRLPLVANSLDLKPDEWAENLTIVNLRGSLVDLKALAAMLSDLQHGEYKVIILDAWYRFQPAGMDENANSDVMQLYNLLDSVAARIGSAFICVHHSSKGDQSGKATTDVGSGAGSQSRAADCHMVMRAHEADNAVVVDAAVRSWKPLKPFCLRWEFPAWTPADDLDPADIKRPNSKKTKADGGDADPDAVRETKEQAARLKLLEAYEVTPEGNTESKLRAAAGMNGKTFDPIQAGLIRDRLVSPCKVKKNNGATYEGFRVTEAGLTELRQLRQLRQNTGESELSYTTQTAALSLESGVSLSVVSDPPEFDQTFTGGRPA